MSVRTDRLQAVDDLSEIGRTAATRFDHEASEPFDLFPDFAWLLSVRVSKISACGTSDRSAKCIDLAVLL